MTAKPAPKASTQAARTQAGRTQAGCTQAGSTQAGRTQAANPQAGRTQARGARWRRARRLVALLARLWNRSVAAMTLSALSRSVRSGLVGRRECYSAYRESDTRAPSAASRTTAGRPGRRGGPGDPGHLLRRLGAVGAWPPARNKSHTTLL